MAEAEKLGGQAKSFRASYDQSTRTTGAYGYRPRVALDAAIAKKAGAASPKKVYDDEHYQKLPLDQQEDIRAYLGDKKKGPWDYWDAKDYANFFLVTRPYSMDALLSTYGARGKATADQVRQKYDELGKPWGLRQWIALMTAYNKGGGENAGWILGHPGYKALYHDQRASIRRALGLPSATDVLAAETGCVDSAA